MVEAGRIVRSTFVRKDEERGKRTWKWHTLTL
jgi:hypothetical protein